MKGNVLRLAVALITGGCASAHEPTAEVDGYFRIAIPEGCYGHEGDHNIQLASEFEHLLVDLLKTAPSDAMCWHEHSDGGLLVEIGDECGPHREAEFLRVTGSWMLKDEHEVPLVLCEPAIERSSALEVVRSH
jgi:hypothetical protein